MYFSISRWWTSELKGAPQLMWCLIWGSTSCHDRKCCGDDCQTRCNHYNHEGDDDDYGDNDNDTHRSQDELIFEKIRQLDAILHEFLSSQSNITCGKIIQCIHWTKVHYWIDSINCKSCHHVVLVIIIFVHCDVWSSWLFVYFKSWWGYSVTHHHISVHSYTSEIQPEGRT